MLSHRAVKLFSLWLVGLGAPLMAQSAQDTAAAVQSLTSTVNQLQQQVRELQSAVEQIRDENVAYKEEAHELRQELAKRDQAASPDRATLAARTETSAATQAAASQERDARLDEEFQLLSGKVDEQYQTKVEGWSKYRIRLSGIVLFNLFSNQGTVDNADIPALALPNALGTSGGSFGATLRQSQIGLSAEGPRFAGAQTSADIRFDFGGGFAGNSNSVNYGLAWLRTAAVRLDWTNTSVIAGQDALFISPISPSSFASLSVPALSYAGNLWTWTPQVRVEHRFALADDSTLLVQGGILDNLDGEAEYYFYRTPQAGEASRQPAYASRVAWTRSVFGQLLTIGVGDYYGRQNYGFDRNINAWAGMTDVTLPLSPRFTLSGKFYRGNAIGGLSGGLDTSVLYTGDPTKATTAIYALPSAGGWAQLKYKPLSKLEFNVAFGEDNPFASDIRNQPGNTSFAGPALIRNQGILANFIYRPRTDLLFSTEYHYLKSFALGNQNFDASQVNLMMGVLF